MRGNFFSSNKKINYTLILCLTYLFILFVASLFCDFLAPFSFEEQHIDDVFLSPNKKYFFGTDQLGRDVFSRVLFGARTSLLVGLMTSVITLVTGAVYGACAGWCGGYVDRLMMRTIDVLDAIPTLIIMILVKITFDAFLTIDNMELKSIFSTIFALGLVGWISLARLIRIQVIQLKSRDFVESARAYGATSLQIIVKQLGPNMLSSVLVLLTLQIPSNILFESFLSFIGLGLQPPYSSWGVLVAEGAGYLESYPHLIIFPGLVLFITMLVFQLLGESLRHKIDSK